VYKYIYTCDLPNQPIIVCWATKGNRTYPYTYKCIWIRIIYVHTYIFVYKYNMYMLGNQRQPHVRIYIHTYTYTTYNWYTNIHINVYTYNVCTNIYILMWPAEPANYHMLGDQRQTLVQQFFLALLVTCRNSPAPYQCTPMYACARVYMYTCMRACE